MFYFLEFHLLHHNQLLFSVDALYKLVKATTHTPQRNTYFLKGTYLIFICPYMWLSWNPSSQTFRTAIYTGWPKKNNTENMSNIHNKVNTCISSKCKSQWTFIGQIHFRYLSAVISLNNYSFNILTYSYCIYAKNIISVCIILVSFGIVFFVGHPVYCVQRLACVATRCTQTRMHGALSLIPFTSKVWGQLLFHVYLCWT